MCLPQEALAQLGHRRELGRQHLQGHRAVESQVTREVYRAHAAAAKLALEAITVREGSGEGHDFVGQRRPFSKGRERKSIRVTGVCGGGVQRATPPEAAKIDWPLPPNRSQGLQIEPQLQADVRQVPGIELLQRIGTGETHQRNREQVAVDDGQLHSHLG